MTLLSSWGPNGLYNELDHSIHFEVYTSIPKVGLMVVTAKQLRLKTSQILKKVQRVGSATVTLRGKPVARLTAVNREKEKPLTAFRAFGMWSDRKDIRDASAWVRKIRRPRYSLH